MAIPPAAIVARSPAPRLATTTDAATARYVHTPLGGILSQHDAAGAWHWALVDGLGSVRGMVVDKAFTVEGSRGFAPYGLPMDEAGSVTLPFAFTGEPRDGNGLQYHRARYYNPMVGVFPSLDPLEVGNRYAYVGGNVVNQVDPSGNVAVEIWASSFIEPSEIEFPYFNPSKGYFDLDARWHGDGRSFYTGVPPLPAIPVQSQFISSRTWWIARFDFCNINSTFVSDSGTGQTTVTHDVPSLWAMGYVSKTVSRKASDPPKPTFTVTSNNAIQVVEVEIEGAVGNPLIAGAPAINAAYHITINSWGSIIIAGKTDIFPWHEIWVNVDGSIISYQHSPSALSESPLDLVWPSVSFLVTRSIHGSFPCVTTIPRFPRDFIAEMSHKAGVSCLSA